MSNKRALVVDDSKVGRLTMKKKLEAIGVTVELVDSGQEALDYLAQQRPDVIFMDHMMPDMDGFETTRRIKSAPATHDIPVIIISGNDDEAFVQEARSTGAIHAITKPPAAGVLEGILGSLPELAAAPAPAAVAQAAPPPVAVDSRAAPFMDQAAVHAYVERVLGELVEHLHSDLLAELRGQMEAELEKERATWREWSEGWAQQLERTAAGLAELRQGALDAEPLRQQLTAMEQRLLPLESGAGREPDVAGLLEQVDLHMGPRLAALQALAEREAPSLDGVRDELLGAVGERQAQFEGGLSDLASRLEEVAEDVRQLADGTLSSEAGHDQHLAAIEKRLATVEASEPPAAPDLEALLSAVDARLEPRLADLHTALQAEWAQQAPAAVDEGLQERLAAMVTEQQQGVRGELDGARNQLQALAEAQEALKAELAAQEERLAAAMQAGHEGFTTRYESEREQLAASLERLTEDMRQLAEGAQSSVAGHGELLDELAKRLAALETAGPEPRPDVETLLSDLEARLEPRLADLRQGLQTEFAERPAAPLEETVQESLSGLVREQQESMRTELEGMRNQLQAMAELQEALKAELATRDEGLKGTLADEGERLAALLEQERARLASDLQAQQSRLAEHDEDAARRFQALETRLEEMARGGIDAGVQRGLEQRMAQMREVVSAVLQPDYPGRGAGFEAASSTGEGGRLLQEIEAEVSDLRERLSDTHLHHLIADAMAESRPAAEVEQQVEERVAQRLAEHWNNRLRAEVTRFEGKVKTLTVILAAGGGALLAAVAMLALMR